MIATLWLLLGICSILLFVFYFRTKKFESLLNQRESETETLKREGDAARRGYQADLIRIRTETQATIDQGQAEMHAEVERVRKHYQVEAQKIQSAADALLTKTLKDLEALRRFEGLRDAEAEVRAILDDALKDAAALKSEAESLLEQNRTASAEERAKALEAAKEIHDQAETLLTQATRDAARILDQAHKQAEQIAGDAYVALRDKDRLEQAAKAMRNVIEGYGDRYIIPTRSLLDELAADFGHTAAGQTLAVSRKHSRRLVEEGHAADCDYAEANRRETAVRFVIDAFNGRVDAILTRTKHDNYGTLEQEVRDAFALVNQNGTAFRNARILPSYFDSRIAELRWAVIVQELRLKEREEQRSIKEQIREEEKARREYERVIQETQREEQLLKQALEKACAQAQRATAEQRAHLEGQIAMLNQKLTEAEAKNRRALSMAQQTRKGNIYIISNVGSFGEEVFKIGMTRRLEPMERIYELGDASVPFDFDVHAMIPCDDAPAFESLLHTEFDDLRINKVNYRKEFFRLPLERLRKFITSRSVEASFTMIAEAHEYRETLALNKMTPEQRERYHLRNANSEDSMGD
jgi:F0F1-type ATP synthase membrane subunit b/b'